MIFKNNYGFSSFNFKTGWALDSFPTEILMQVQTGIKN